MSTGGSLIEQMEETVRRLDRELDQLKAAAKLKQEEIRRHKRALRILAHSGDESSVARRVPALSERPESDQ